jgi:hypothetical protein
MHSRDRLQPVHRVGHDLLLALPHRVDAHGVLELHRECGLDRLEEAWRSGVLARLDVVEEGVLAPWIGPRDRAAPRFVGHRVVVQRAIEDHHARRARTAEELVRREEHRIERGLGIARGVHVDRNVWRRCGEVDDRDPTRTAHQSRHLVVRREDAGHVRAGAERADLERALGEGPQLFLQRGEAHQAARVSNDDHVGDRLVPRV